MEYANEQFLETIKSDYLQDAYKKMTEFQKEQARLKTIRKMIMDEIGKEQQEQKRLEKERETKEKLDKFFSYEKPFDYPQLLKFKLQQRNSKFF